MSATLTVYIAAPGTPVSQEPNTGLPGTSTAGHTWFSISPDGSTQNSFGFAPDPQHSGQPIATGSVYTNDLTNYNGGNTASLAYTQTVNISDQQYQALAAFGAAGIQASRIGATTFTSGGTTFSESYNVLTNSCIDYMWAALGNIGIQRPQYFAGGELVPTWNISDVKNALTTFTAGSPSSFRTTQTIYDSQGTLEGDTVINPLSGVTYTSTYMYSADKSSVTITTKLAGGTTVQTAAETVNTTTNAIAADDRGFNTDGTQRNEQVIHAGPDGSSSAAISGAGVVLNANNAVITDDSGGNPYSLNTLTGTNNNISLSHNAALNLSDGSVNKFTTDGTTSILNEKYGTINLTPGVTNVDLRGNNNNVAGGSQNHTIVEGLNDTYTGSGGEVDPGTGSSLTVTGQDVVGLASNVDLTASNCTFNMSMSGLTGDTILGSYDTFHDLGGFQATIGGTYDTGLTGADSLNFLGATTGDSTDGGSTISNPDPYPPPPEPVSDDDPIILSLNGAKVQTQNLTSSSAYFDIQNVGTPVHTGWGTAGEGYLVYDPTNKNTVTNEQSLVASFAALKALDLNHDNVLNSLDAAWASMKVWVDSAGTGKSTAGSLKTMDQIGISSINLNSAHLNQNQNNNTILDDSTFTWKAGGTGDIAGVDLNFHAASVITVTGGGGGGGGGGGAPGLPH